MRTFQLRGVWLAIAILASILAGTAAAALAYFAGDHPARAAITGAGAAAAALALAITALTFLVD